MKIANFSLDYVPSGAGMNQAPNQANLPDVALNEAAVLYGQPVLKSLQQAPKKQMRLYELMDQVNIERQVSDFEQFQGVINHLCAMGMVKVVEKDTRGNNLIELIKTS